MQGIDRMETKKWALERSEKWAGGWDQGKYTFAWKCHDEVYYLSTQIKNKATIPLSPFLLSVVSKVLLEQ